MLKVSMYKMRFKTLTKNTFEKHGDIVLFMLKVHFLKYMVEDVGIFGSLSILSTPPFQMI